MRRNGAKLLTSGWLAYRRAAALIEAEVEALHAAVVLGQFPHVLYAAAALFGGQALDGTDSGPHDGAEHPIHRGSIR